MPDSPTAAEFTLPEGVMEDVRSALSLPNEKLAKINEWVRSNHDVVLGLEVSESDVHDKLGISSNQFFSVLSTIGTFVFGAGDKEPADVSGFVNAIKDRGLDDRAEKVRILLQGIQIDPKRVEYSRRRTFGLRSVIPTLEGVSTLCDLRAIFGASPSAVRSDTHTGDVKTLLGVEPIALVSISTNDADGHDHAYEFQITERELQNLIKTLNETVEQMQILKGSKIAVK